MTARSIANVWLPSSPWRQTISAVAAESYAREVLDEAYRRAFRFHGIRMQQFADCGAERGDLAAEFIAIRDDLADRRRRAEAAAKPGWSQP